MTQRLMTDCRRFAAFAVIVPLIIAISGCPQPTTEEPPTELDASEIAAIDAVLPRVAMVCRSLNSWRNLADGLRIAEGETIASPACPVVTWEPHTTTGAVSLDFAAGCTSSALANLVVEGLVHYDISLATHDGVISLTDHWIDETPVTGSATVGYTISDADDVTLAGTLNLCTFNTTASGVCSFTYVSTGEIVINYAFWRIFELGGDIDLGNIAGINDNEIIINPVDNPAMIPTNGYIGFSLSGGRRVQIHFDEDTPDTGKIDVWINEYGPFEYSIDDVDPWTVFGGSPS